MPWYSCRRCGEIARFENDEAAAANPCDCVDSEAGDWERFDPEAEGSHE
jgi:hypothetical protein